MLKPKTLEEVYDRCSADGAFIEVARHNSQKLRDLIENAETNIESAEILAKGLPKNDRKWMTVYIQYYEALRIYAEAWISSKGRKIVNHRCLFAFLCNNFSELDWDFFEKIRTKRNGANYYGEKIVYEDWKTISFQIKLYISTLKKEIEKNEI